MSSQVLAMYLDSPLQSWGYQSRFDRRTSLSYPTRSAIVGMLCAALGIDRADTTALERLEEGLSIAVYTLGRPTMLTDYHTVGGGYDRKHQPQCIVRTADGKVGDTVQTYREYLQDARFGVVIRGPVETLVDLCAALADPKWGVWLGRKSCIPSSPILQGLFATEDEARSHLERLAGRAATRRVGEVDRFDAGTDTLLDRPVDFSDRRFRPRRVDNEPL